MSNRTQIVCMHEGELGSIDPLFIRTLIKALDPAWIRPWKGNSAIRTVPKGGRATLIHSMPAELRAAVTQGGDTTLMVWADVDDDMYDPDGLRQAFWTEARKQAITKQDFDRVVFIFARDRIENWIEFLNTGTTNEEVEGERTSLKATAAAAHNLAEMCKNNTKTKLPDSLEWSCKNWRTLVKRMGS